MQRTVEQIAQETGIEAQEVRNFLAAHKIRATGRDGAVDYYDECSQFYFKILWQKEGKEA